MIEGIGIEMSVEEVIGGMTGGKVIEGMIVGSTIGEMTAGSTIGGMIVGITTVGTREGRVIGEIGIGGTVGMEGNVGMGVSAGIEIGGSVGIGMGETRGMGVNEGIGTVGMRGRIECIRVEAENLPKNTAPYVLRLGGSNRVAPMTSGCVTRIRLGNLSSLRYGAGEP